MSPFVRNVIKNLLNEVKDLKEQVSLLKQSIDYNSFTNNLRASFSTQHDYEDLKSLGVDSGYFVSPDRFSSCSSYWNNEDNDKRDEFVVNHRWLDNNKKDTK